MVRHPVKWTLKRGALVTAANWQVILIQAVADSLFKALVAMPLVGGIFLVALVVGAEPGTLLALGWRDLAATILTSLMSRPLVLAAFVGAVAIVLVGGSLFVFLVKAGTVAILVRGERAAGEDLERLPIRATAMKRAAAFSIESFVEAAGALWPRYARLGVMLMAVYLGSAAAYLAATFGGSGSTAAWATMALLTALFVAWITLVNLVYLLMQIAIAADDCAVSAAWRRVAAFVRRERQQVMAVFAVVLVLVGCATGASLVATTALGLISFVPVLGLTVLPLQLVAWLFRGLVFQYIGLSSIGAYLNVYRTASATLAERAAGEIPLMTMPGAER